MMRAYGLDRKDRVICKINGCSCGDFSSKHPILNRSNKIKNKRMKKHERQNAKQDVLGQTLDIST